MDKEDSGLKKTKLENPAEPAVSENDYRSVTLIYFGPIREKIGRSEERVMTSVCTASDLYRELQKKYGLLIPYEQVRVAVNGCIQQSDARLEPNATIVFLPPFGGG